MGKNPIDFFITMAGVCVVILVYLAGRALNRHHIQGKGIYAQAHVLHVQAHKDPSLRIEVQRADIFYVVQLAIPRPDGTELIGTVTVLQNPPKPGWTVPVSYIERLGSTTKVATVGPFRPVAESAEPQPQEIGPDPA